MKKHERITWSPKIMGGRACIKGTRVPVSTILHWLSVGETPDALLKEYPHLNKEDIFAAQAFAADIVDNERVIETAAE
ncbi:MAG: DUF433 domain-containing protein [Hyphomicrobiaceae bacterium]